jgi:hypothetical protein
MMARNPIEIPLASETRAFRQGIDSGVIDPLEDAVKALDELGKSRGPDQLESDLKAAQTATEKLERDTKQAADAIDRDYRDGYRKMKHSADDGFGKASGAAAEFKGEALQNVSEVVSSFDGSMESIGEVVQGTLGGVSANLGLLGAAAVPIAASVGLITEAFVKAGEATDEARESAYTYGLTVAETGQYADATSRINELTGSVEELRKVQDIATVAGWDQKDVLTALATGDGLPALTKAFDDGANSTSLATGRALELNGVLEGTAQGFDLATHGAALNASALYDLASQAGVATGDVDALGNTIVAMPDGKEIVLDADTQTAHENLDALEQRQLADKEVRLNLTVDDTRWRNWQPNAKFATVIPQAPAGIRQVG